MRKVGWFGWATFGYADVPNCKKDMVMGGASYCQDCGVKLEWNLSGTTFLPERG